MSSIYVITTHHSDRKDEAADAWHGCGVCAVGFEPGEKQHEKFRQIDKGDLILAFSGAKTIAYVGEAMGTSVETDRNIVGKEGGGGFGYPYQHKVQWYANPHHFLKAQLPGWMGEQFGTRGKTVVRLELESYSFDEAKDIILNTVKSGTFFYINEDTVKAGIKKYLGLQLDSLERGLKIKRAEDCISETDRLDFRAEDRSGRPVIIECKGSAVPGDCDQLKRYKRPMAKEKPRLMLVAFKFEDGCRKQAAKDNIELFECDLTFKKLARS